MNDLFQKIEMKNVMSFLKAVNLYEKSKEYFQQDKISTNCSSTRNASTKSDPIHKLFLKKQKLSTKDDSLQINF